MRICGGKDLLRRCDLSLEWKRVGVMDGESGDEGAGGTIGEWNEKRMNGNDSDEADGMKKEVGSKDTVFASSFGVISCVCLCIVAFCHHVMYAVS